MAKPVALGVVTAGTPGCTILLLYPALLGV